MVIKRTLPFVIIVNIHFRNYYVPSRAYARERPFNDLDLTSSESTFTCIIWGNGQTKLRVHRPT